jgi:membrane protein implicated in regulation of membrane protease activity
VAQLVGDISNQISTLVRDEIQLAMAELQQKGKRIGVGAGLLGGAGAVALCGLGALIAGLILLLALVMPAWLAAFLVGVAVLIVAAVLAMLGRRQVQRGVPPVPEEAVAGIKQDIATVREGTQR